MGQTLAIIRRVQTSPGVMTPTAKVDYLVGLESPRGRRSAHNAGRVAPPNMKSPSETPRVPPHAYQTDSCYLVTISIYPGFDIFSSHSICLLGCLLSI